MVYNEVKMSEPQTYPLPKKPVQWNNLIRIINFDTRIEGTLFIETHREFDPINRKWKIWAYRQDIMEDRTSIFKKGKAREIKRKHEKTFSVRYGFYIPAGVGMWSDQLPFALILPDQPERLPAFIKNKTTYLNGFSQMLKDTGVDTALVTHLEEGMSQMGEQLAKREPDKEEERFFKKLERTGNLIFKQKEKPAEPPKKDET